MVPPPDQVCPHRIAGVICSPFADGQHDLFVLLCVDAEMLDLTLVDAPRQAIHLVTQLLQGAHHFQVAMDPGDAIVEGKIELVICKRIAFAGCEFLNSISSISSLHCSRVTRWATCCAI